MKHRKHGNTGKQRTVRPVPKLLTCALASCLMMGAPSVFAQSANANLRGQVMTDSTPAAGTEVIATNNATGFVRRTQTNANGSYTLTGLPPGTYTVQAGGTSQTVTLSVASNSTLNLQAGGVAETGPQQATDLATVTVTAPLLKDVKTSEVGNTVSLRQIQTLPQASRNFLEFADTVPGMAFTTDDQGVTTPAWRRAPTAHRAICTSTASARRVMSRAAAWPARTAAAAIRSRSSPSASTRSLRRTTRPSTARSPAPRSPRRRVRAPMNSRARPTTAIQTKACARSALPRKRQAKRRTDSLTREWGFAVGGPIIQDRMHFFFAYEKKDFITPRVVFPASNTSEFAQFLPAGRAERNSGRWSHRSRKTCTSARSAGTSAIATAGAERTGPRRRRKSIRSAASASLEHGRDVINKDKRGTLRWQHSADTWFNEVLVTYGGQRSQSVPDQHRQRHHLYKCSPRTAATSTSAP